MYSIILCIYILQLIVGVVFDMFYCCQYVKWDTMEFLVMAQGSFMSLLKKKENQKRKWWSAITVIRNILGLYS